MFCYPEHINSEMARVFGSLKTKNWLRGLQAEDFSREATHFLAELNAIHPFRDGNGRTQLAFVTLLAFAAGYQVNVDRIEPEQFLAAMIESFYGREQQLMQMFQQLISPIG